ncbi:MAG: hypothetical protein ABJE95_17180 [Byssovorax sp.]
MASYRCKNPDCAYSDTGVCARATEFSDPETECDDLQNGRAQPNDGAPDTRVSIYPSVAALEPAIQDGGSESDARIEPSRFWSGSALGGEEAGEFLWDPRSKLFTIMGGEDRGKTCFLTAFYIQLANGYTAGFPWRFCGSRSLQGFQRLTDPAFDWQGGEKPIVPRSTQSSFRQPSFLHVALKRDGSRHALPTHLILTDMPGEWFDTWIDMGSSGLPDTLEFLPRSDGFLLVIDAPAVLTNREYRKNVSYLLDRLIAFLGLSTSSAAPIAVVLAKYDKIAHQASLPEGDMRRDAKQWGILESRLAALFKRLDELPPNIPWNVFPCAAFSQPGAQPVGVLAPFAFLLEETMRLDSLPPMTIEPEYRGSFFEVFRGDRL